MLPPYFYFQCREIGYFSVVLALFSIFTTNFLEMHQTYLLEICFGEQHCYE